MTYHADYTKRKTDVLRRISANRPFFPPSCWWEPEGPCARHDNEKGLEKTLKELEERGM